MSCLKHKANKSKDPMGIAKFKRQGNLVVKLNKQVKLQRFQKLSVDSNSKLFWKACKTLSEIKIATYRKTKC